MTVVWLVLDQVTKIWVVNNVRYRTEEIKVIDGFFSIVHAQNKGAAMGMFHDFEHRMLLFGSSRWSPSSSWPRCSGRYRVTVPVCRPRLILSGALGNAIDRIDKQSVTDFPGSTPSIRASSRC